MAQDAADRPPSRRGGMAVRPLARVGSGRRRRAAEDGARGNGAIGRAGPMAMLAGASSLARQAAKEGRLAGATA